MKDDSCHIQNNWKLRSGKSQTSVSSRQLGPRKETSSVWENMFWAPTWRSLMSWFDLVFFWVHSFLQSTKRMTDSDDKVWWQNVSTRRSGAPPHKVSPKMSCIPLHKLCNMPGRYVYCSLESNTKCMLCSKLLVAHVPRPNSLVPFPLTYCSDLVVYM
jgi:hypothetical protein